ncbi:hypothetical protein WICPIJ_006301 [Wickerhamomyces pijperi]|uniref:MHD domain-containing protein n=1 Tax=Wickerhamomyces pijperi TaxID=599730 RepID=A0A9P8TL55_WICPI|nr:hypothetical protein WICPIJ_006301 [Wickerhamomyces pijperi]
MASVVSILSAEDLSPLISRTYTLDLIPLSELHFQFQQSYRHHEHTKTLTPLIHHNGVTYLYVRSGEVLILLICYGGSRINVVELFTFIYKLETIMKSYFQISNVASGLNRGYILDNFDLIYELFDEVMDFGVPQLTEVGILKDVIKLEVTRPEFAEDYTGDLLKEQVLNNEVNSSVLRGATNTISWRPRGIYYPKNEIFVDLVEYNTLVIDSDLNTIIRNEVKGEIKLRCYLSGMPVLRIQLSEDILKKINTESLKLGQFVDLIRFDHDSGIHFIPPDGDSTLLSYKVLNFNKKPLVQVISYSTDVLDHKNRLMLNTKLIIRLNVKIKSNFKNIQISLPKPQLPNNNNNIDNLSFDNNFNPRFKSKYGKVLYDFSTDRIIWSIESFKDNEINKIEEISMTSQFALYDSSDESAGKVDLGMNPPPKRDTPLFKQINSGIDKERKEDTTEPSSEFSKKEIRIKFDLQNETYTGLKIQYLKLEKEFRENKGDKWGVVPQDDPKANDKKEDEAQESGYKLEYTLFPWIRYMSCSDDEFVYRLK